MLYGNSPQAYPPVYNRVDQPKRSFAFFDTRSLGELRQLFHVNSDELHRCSMLYAVLLVATVYRGIR